jgi:hypothetical protein
MMKKLEGERTEKKAFVCLATSAGAFVLLTLD